MIILDMLFTIVKMIIILIGSIFGIFIASFVILAIFFAIMAFIENRR